MEGKRILVTGQNAAVANGSKGTIIRTSIKPGVWYVRIDGQQEPLVRLHVFEFTYIYDK